jgi:catechol 2,3-dioxygenase-like lactoylglutathione lyase family enzyme
MALELLDHFTIRCRDLERTRNFYRDVLGFETGDRPAFDFDGYWLYCGERPVVHLVKHDDLAAMSGVAGLVGDELALAPVGERTGAVDHVAFRATGRQEMMKKLDAMKVKYRYNPVPGGQLHQLFIRDPDGVVLELNFSS